MALTYLRVYVGIGVPGPVTAGLLHGRIESEVRSTVMSVECLALQAGAAVASLAAVAAASTLTYDVSHAT